MRMRRKEYQPIQIDPLPMLAVMLIWVKCTMLIALVFVVRISMGGPSGPKRVQQGVSFHETQTKSPVYLDCHADQIIIYPGAKVVTWQDLLVPDNAVEQMLNRVQANAASQYVMILARPSSEKFFRAARKMVRDRLTINVADDAITADETVETYKSSPPPEAFKK
jgi:hypothetical protein